MEGAEHADVERVAESVLGTLGTSSMFSFTSCSCIGNDMRLT